jgi:CrcB protein
MKFLAVALAGALGALARVGLASWTQTLIRGAFPIGTLAVNVVGCFAMGLVAAAFEDRIPASSELRLVLFGGFLGAFTTFSAFSYESLELWQAGWHVRAASYILASLLLSLLAVSLGWTLGGRIGAN